MKKKIITLLLLTAVFSLRFPLTVEAKSPDDQIFEIMTRQDYYLTAGVVVDVTNTEFVTVMLPDGNLYTFWGDGWAKGDIAAIMMDGKGTPSIKDDEILLAQPVRR